MSRGYPAAARFRFAILRNEFKHRESHSHIVQVSRSVDFVSVCSEQSIAPGRSQVLKKARHLCDAI
jgi:hypothetical protein